MSRYAWNKASPEAKRRYFELVRQGSSGSEAARAVGVSLSCGSLWFIDAGSVKFIDKPISSRYLSQDDRIEIAEGLRAGESVKEIAGRIGKSFQSIYREIARNRTAEGRYQPWHAHGQAHLRRARPKIRRIALDEGLRQAIAGRLARRWSPQQISRWLRRRWPRKPRWQVCAETIYEAVYRGIVGAKDAQTLRTGRSYRHKRGRGRSREGSLKQSTTMRSIHDRPASVQTRRQIGHWEGDLVVGAFQRSAIATLVERKSRYTLIVEIPGAHTAQRVGDALIAVFCSLPARLRRTLTWDHGNELFQHQRIADATGLKIYFADPHSPWQRGTNENTNGLIRQYFPKGTDFTSVPARDLQAAEDELNDRPRACLNDRSPNQLMARWNLQARSA